MTTSKSCANDCARGTPTDGSIGTKFGVMAYPVTYLAVDDLHPKRTGDDYGSLTRAASGVGPFLHVARNHPWLKIVLFVTAAWRWANCDPPLKPHQFRLTRHPDWCRQLADALPANVCIGLHGHEHYARSNLETPWVEFGELSLVEAHQRLSQMLAEFEAVGLPYRRIFRPPGWGLSRASEEALRAANIRTLCASCDIYVEPDRVSTSEAFGLRGVPAFVPARLASGVVNVPANFDIGWSKASRAMDIVRANGCLGLTGHVADTCYGTHLGNGPTPKNMKRLDALLVKLRHHYDAGCLRSLWPDQIGAELPQDTDE